MAKIKKPYSKCVDLAKKIAKARDGYMCLRCGRSLQGGFQIHGSHILGTGAHPRLAANPRNIKALCSTCHRWWHSAPTESGKWFKEKFPEWNAEIEKLKKDEGKKPDYNKLYYELKEELKRYES